MESILIIEDNANNLELMNYLLNAFGYTTSQAIDGLAGWERLQKEQPDLILCDIQLPIMDGFALAHLIKKDERLCKIPLIAVTAFAMVGDKERILKGGFNGYITKPIRPETFIDEIKEFLSPNINNAR